MLESCAKDDLPTSQHKSAPARTAPVTLSTTICTTQQNRLSRTCAPALWCCLVAQHLQIHGPTHGPRSSATNAAYAACPNESHPYQPLCHLPLFHFLLSLLQTVWSSAQVSTHPSSAHRSSQLRRPSTLPAN